VIAFSCSWIISDVDRPRRHEDTKKKTIDRKKRSLFFVSSWLLMSLITLMRLKAVGRDGSNRMPSGQKEEKPLLLRVFVAIDVADYPRCG
jgi:hypothetical protein